LQSHQYPQHSLSKEELIPETKKVSLRNERSVSPSPADLGSSKYSKSSLEEPISQKTEVLNKNQDSIDLKLSVTINEQRVPTSKKDGNQKTPLETSFADHGFAIDNDIDEIQDNNIKLEKGKQERSFSKEIDVDTMPINYNEFVKRSQRSKKVEEGQYDEAIKSRRETSEEPKLETIADESGPQLFFTTTQDENQPLFGTSHFVFEGNQKTLEEDPQADLNQMRRLSDGIRGDFGFKDEIDEDFEKKVTGFAVDIDMEDIVELGEVADLSRISMNYNRKASWTKSMREDLETRPSLMNPMHSVYESTNMMDALQDPQASVDFLSANTRSEIEREREKAFSSRCSVNTVSASRSKGNGSRQKIEGRLKDLEWKLKEMELKNQGLRVEKDKVQFEFEKLMVELKEKKAESEGMKKDSNEPWDEKKEEREIALKNEIKFLINKLLKVKNKLEKQSEELNITKSSNILSQSQVNYSIYQGQGKKDYSKEYGILSGLNNTLLTSQIRERENWNPLTMQSNQSNMQTSQNLRKSIGSEMWNGASQLNTSVAKLENYRVTERGPNKSSLGVAIENFAKNVRSKSNARYDHNRDSQNQNMSLNYSGMKGGESNVNSATTRTHRSKGPILPRPEDMGPSQMNREVLRPINNQNYEGNNMSNSNIAFDGNSSYFQKRSHR